jgi:hypothetical protein
VNVTGVQSPAGNILPSIPIIPSSTDFSPRENNADEVEDASRDQNGDQEVNNDSGEGDESD